MKLQQLTLLFSIMILTIFSITIFISLPKNILAAENSCISYNSIENEISIACQHAEFIDIVNSLQDRNILQQESSNFNENNWILKAGINVEKNANLSIDSNDVTWLKIVPSEHTPNAIQVHGSLKVDSVKITSWNLETDDYVKFPKEAKYEDETSSDEIYSSIHRPYIKVNKDATGPTIIKNSELAYLGYKCSGCGGLTFHGGENSMLINNDIHHIFKGFYSKNMGYMLIEGNHVYNNDKYGIDPHTGTHHMVILNNTVHDNGSSGIICSLDCYYILIEGNEVYNNGEDGPGRGIAFSINMYDSVAKNNYVHHQNNCIGVSGGSHDNEIHNNLVSDCEDGLYTSEEASNNNIYKNTLMNTINGIVVKTGASDNAFHYNKIVNASEVGILKVEDAGMGNTFENNTFENNKVNMQ